VFSRDQFKLIVTRTDLCGTEIPNSLIKRLCEQGIISPVATKIQD